MDRKPLSLRCNLEGHSTLLWSPANHSCIRQELARYSPHLEVLLFEASSCCCCCNTKQQIASSVSLTDSLSPLSCKVSLSTQSC